MNTAPVVVQIDFPFPGPFGPAMEAALKDLALSIAAEPGFLWKIWTESPSSGEAGGVYLFCDRSSAEAYAAKHTARLTSFGITQPRTRIFDVNPGLSKITSGPA